MTRPLVDPRMLSRLGSFFNTTCTIQQTTETRDAAGGVVNSWSNVTGLVNLVCRRAPMTTSRTTEMKLETLTYTSNMQSIVIAGYKPTITPKMRVTCDGIVFDVLSVEHDGEAQMTRLSCQIVET